MSRSVAMQRALLRAYGAAVRGSALRVPGAGAVVRAAYAGYKRWIEAPYVPVLRAYVPAGTIAVDVGANVGFFTRRFAAWVGRGGRVIAIEPEHVNFGHLQRSIRRRCLADRVTLVHAAAAEREGRLRLALDPLHPGNHRLANAGVEVDAVTVDGLIGADERRVSLLKIDVQGAEARVLQGAAATIAAHHPAMLIEIDRTALADQGASVEALVDGLFAIGYRPHLPERAAVGPPLSRAEILEQCARGDYVDALWLWPSDGSWRP